MKLNFKKYLKANLEARLEEILCHFSNKNKVCAKISKEILIVQKQILEELGSHGDLLTNYEALESAKSSILFERAYMQGLIDSIRFLRFSNKIK